MTCPRCSGRMLGKVEPSCVQCGYVRYEVPDFVVVEYESRLGHRAALKKGEGEGRHRTDIRSDSRMQEVKAMSEREAT